MIGCSYAPQVVLFGLWRITSLCYVDPSFYCPMMLCDGGTHAVRGVEVPDDTRMAEHFQKCIDVIEETSAVYMYTHVPADRLGTCAIDRLACRLYLA